MDDLSRGAIIKSKTPLSAVTPLSAKLACVELGRGWFFGCEIGVDE